MKKYKDCHIIVIDNFSNGSFNNIQLACMRYNVGPFDGQIKISYPDSWNDFIKKEKPRAIFHLAAITDTTIKNESLMLKQNQQEFENLLISCVKRKVPLIYASSAAVYGNPKKQIDNKIPFTLDIAGYPKNIYGFSKWMMEKTHLRIVNKNSHVIGLRYFNVFGPNEHLKGNMASMVYQIINQLLNKNSPQIYDDGEQSRDQIYIDDVINCTIAAYEDLRPGIYSRNI